MHAIPCCLGNGEQELLVDVIAADVAEADKASQQGDDLLAGKTGEKDDTVQRLQTLNGGEQQADVIVVGDYGSLRLLRLTPEGKMNGRGYDVLVVDADIGTFAPLFVQRTNGTFDGGGNGGDDDGSLVSMVGVELDARFGLAEFVGSLVHHVNLLFAADTREMTVVANTYEQPTAVGIGESRYRLGQLTSIGHTVFEVLLLVLALANQAEKILLVIAACKVQQLFLVPMLFEDSDGCSHIVWFSLDGKGTNKNRTGQKCEAFRTVRSQNYF